MFHVPFCKSQSTSDGRLTTPTGTVQRTLWHLGGEVSSSSARNMELQFSSESPFPWIIQLLSLSLTWVISVQTCSSVPVGVCQLHGAAIMSCYAASFLCCSHRWDVGVHLPDRRVRSSCEGSCSGRCGDHREPRSHTCRSLSSLARNGSLCSLTQNRNVFNTV